MQEIKREMDQASLKMNEQHTVQRNIWISSKYKNTLDLLYCEFWPIILSMICTFHVRILTAGYFKEPSQLLPI